MAITFTDPQNLPYDDLEEGTRFAPRFDADGLVLAIATDSASGAVLMVAYMNVEALQLTLETGEVHYFSRSRQKLWKKGETSGEIQKLVEMRVDCDQDALLLLVERTGRGAACHTGRRTCFYRRVTADGGAVSLVDTGEPKLFDPDVVYNR